MHILFLTENFPPETNAAATRVFERACYWVKWGHEVTVVTCAPNFPIGKVFPGYVLVQMAMDDHSWFIVRNTPGVTGFVSAEDEKEKRPKPVPLEESEVKAILNQMESQTPRVRVGYTKGQSVRINEGPFADFIGVVDEIYADRGKVRILVSFFGRETPVELDFLQVAKF